MTSEKGVGYISLNVVSKFLTGLADSLALISCVGCRLGLFSIGSHHVGLPVFWSSMAGDISFQCLSIDGVDANTSFVRVSREKGSDLMFLSMLSYVSKVRYGKSSWAVLFTLVGTVSAILFVEVGFDKLLPVSLYLKYGVLIVESTPPTP